MKIEEFQKSVSEMSEEELLELVNENRRRRLTMNESRIKEVQKKSQKKNVKSVIDSLTAEEKAELRAAFAKGKD